MNEAQATALVKLETKYNKFGSRRMWISFEDEKIVIRIRERLAIKDSFVDSFANFEDAVVYLLNVIE